MFFACASEALKCAQNVMKRVEKDCDDEEEWGSAADLEPGIAFLLQHANPSALQATSSGI